MSGSDLIKLLLIYNNEETLNRLQKILKDYNISVLFKKFNNI